MEQPGPEIDQGVSLLDFLALLARHIKLLVVVPLLSGLIALAATYALNPVFTAKTVFLPPQQPQSAAASALSSLGALSSLAGVGSGLRSTADQFVSLMQSATVLDRITDRFGLMEIYRVKLRSDARKALNLRVRISLGKKDGLITLEVDDTDPQRSADIANQFVEELRKVTSGLALTEAQQRRAFFEAQLKKSKEQLAQAQQALQATGFSQGALRSEPKAAADMYARLKAEVTAAEVRLQTMRASLTEAAPEVIQQAKRLSALRDQLAKLEGSLETTSNSDYLSKYREFKYQETLLELFARQYESARLDESREGALIQVVDVATPPDRKSWPKRGVAAVVVTGLSFLLVLAFVLLRNSIKRAAADPATAQKIAALRASLRR